MRGRECEGEGGRGGRRGDGKVRVGREGEGEGAMEGEGGKGGRGRDGRARVRREGEAFTCTDEDRYEAKR